MLQALVYQHPNNLLNYSNGQHLAAKFLIWIRWERKGRKVKRRPADGKEGETRVNLGAGMDEDNRLWLPRAPRGRRVVVQEKGLKLMKNLYCLNKVEAS